MNRMFALFLALAIFFSMTACGSVKTEKEPSSKDPEPDGIEILDGPGSYIPFDEPEEIPAGTTGDDSPAADYAVGNPCPQCTVQHTYYDNNLITQEVVVEEGLYNATTVRISGLKDKNVEETINTRIEEVFNELNSQEQPPYPGIEERLAIFDQYENADSYGYCTACVQSSFNNMLSVAITKGLNKYVYSDEFSDELIVCDFRTLNFDLNTGKEIRIEDLFADNVDGITYLNEKIKKEAEKPGAFDELTTDWYAENSGGIHFRKAFEGINKNQKFYINSWDGSISLVLDYENPEIVGLFTPAIYSIDMQGINAYESRFMASESLFTDETRKPRLFEVPYNTVGAQDNYDYTENWIPEYGISLSSDAATHEDMPQIILDQLDPALWLDSFKEDCCCYYEVLARENEGTALNATAGFFSYASRYGDYTNTYVNTNFYVADSQWQYLANFENTLCQTFASGCDTPMGLDQVFVPDCDMYQLMEDGAVARMTELLGDKYSQDTYIAMFRDTVTHLEGFSITGDSITIDCYAINDIINTYLPDEVDNYELPVCLTSLKYEDLGMENLTIFN